MKTKNIFTKLALFGIWVSAGVGLQPANADTLKAITGEIQFECQLVFDKEGSAFPKGVMTITPPSKDYPFWLAYLETRKNGFKYGGAFIEDKQSTWLFRSISGGFCADSTLEISKTLVSGESEASGFVEAKSCGANAVYKCQRSQH